ncbi:MAG: glycosyltransferase family 4 protein [Acidobacteria bacterium]|nr:glycosyltransferase family 4 protein [Acidobacteriota bacterium]
MNVRILQVVGDSKFGGASFAILRLAGFWTSLGWQVEILATDPVFLDAARRAGVRTVELDVIWRAIRPFRDLLGLIRLWRFLRMQPYTVVHTHTTKAGFVGRIAARLAGVPIVIHTAHGFAFHEGSPPRKIAFYTLLDRIASWACDRVITVSHFHADWGKRLGIASPEKIRAVPNGIPDPPRFSRGEREELRESLGVKPGQIVLFTPGRLAAEKGLEDMVEAVAQLRSYWGDRLVVWFAGEGPLRPQLEELVQQRALAGHIRFLGFRSDVPLLLDASDIVVLPTWREGLSIALLEAMAAGKAIVTTSISPNIEATQSGKGAILVPPGQPTELAGAIAAMAIDPALRLQKQAAARNVFLNNYTDSVMLAGYHRLYLELLKRVDPTEYGSSEPAVACHPIHSMRTSVEKEIQSAEPVSCLQPSSDR